MAKKVGTEYGVLVAPIAPIDSDTGLSKRTFFERLEDQYPVSQGWVVVHREVLLTAGNGYAMAYHVERVNE